FSLTPGSFLQNTGIRTIVIEDGSTGNINASSFTTGITLTGGDNGDTLIGGIGDDTIEGGEGDDVLRGNNGNDTITSNGGNDSVTGGAGNDIINVIDQDASSDDDNGFNVDAGSGDDVVTFSAAFMADEDDDDDADPDIDGDTDDAEDIEDGDIVAGGAGNDVLVLDSGVDLNSDTVTGFETLRLLGGDDQVATGAGASEGRAFDYDVTLANENIATGTTFTVDATQLRGDVDIDGDSDNDENDSLTLDLSNLMGNRSVVVNGGGGELDVTGSDGVDVVNVGDGAATLALGGGADRINLSDGDARDVLTFAESDTTLTALDRVTGFNIDDTADSDTDDTDLEIDDDADVIDFDAEIVDDAGDVANGVIVGDLAEAVEAEASLLAAITLITDVFENSADTEDGAFAFEYRGNTYVAVVDGDDSDSASIDDIVRLDGVTGVNAIANVDTTPDGMGGIEDDGIVFFG
ncbi:MAG: calcium-binding protein, partial [Pacificimonas sp.]